MVPLINRALVRSMWYYVFPTRDCCGREFSKKEVSFCATQPPVSRGFLFFLLLCLHHAEDLLRLSHIFKFLCTAPSPPAFNILRKALAIASCSSVLLPIFATFLSVLLNVYLCTLKDLYVEEAAIRHSASCRVKQAESRFH